MNSSVRSDRPVPGATNGMPFAVANARSSGREIGPIQHRAHRSIPGQRGPPSGLPKVSGTTECAVVGHFPDRLPTERRRGGKVQARWDAPDRTRDRVNSVAMDPGDRTFVVPDARLARVVFRPGTVSVGLKAPRRGESVQEDLPRGENVHPSPISIIVLRAVRFSIPRPWVDLCARRVVPSENRSLRRLPFRFPLWLLR